MENQNFGEVGSMPPSEPTPPDTKKSKKWLIIVIIVVVSLIVLGVIISLLIKNFSQKVAEKGLEAYLGPDTSVINTGREFGLETEKGTFKMGEDVGLPENCPEDFIIYSGANVATVLCGTPEKKDSMMLLIEAQKDEVANFYKQELVSRGWQDMGTVNAAMTTTSIFRKGDTEMSVSIMSESMDELAIMVGSYPVEEEAGEEVDTDGDGLSDWYEQNIYFTNSAEPDSDGDGYTDGEEVQSGYNPLGPGKLEQ